MLYEIVVPQAKKMLHNLSAILDKGATLAEAKKFDTSVLLHARLAPDQFNLIRQVQIACDTAKLGVSRLTGKDAPVNDDKEQALAELKTRIDQTLSYLGTFSAKDFVDAEKKHISQPRWEGKYLTGLEFVVEHMLPNLYFHVTTTYAILRHNGVEVGKTDYLGAMPFKK